jgi:NadR type nicotinamide-nucleotide adenylyltransferase
VDAAVPERFRAGLVFGKFLPPHEGHRFLVETARRRVDHLTVAVCSLRREPIPGRLRLDWLRQMFPAVEVVLVEDENPQYPEEHPEFWSIWSRTLRRACRVTPEVLFSSEEYGDEMARHLGVRHQAVDPPRRTVPISATRVRERPAACWDWVPAPVRPYLLKRVVVTGPESTGKTTLAERLARYYGTRWVPEYARGHLDAVYPARGTGEVCRAEDIEPIARGQIAAEDGMAREATRVLIADTDLIVTKVYAEHYFGSCPAWIREAALARRYDLHLLLDVDVPWVPDRQRDQGHARERFHALFRRELAEHGCRVVELSGSWDERFAAAVSAVDAVLLEPMRPLA